MIKIMITPEAYAAIIGKMPSRDQIDHTGKVGLWCNHRVAQDLRRQRRIYETYSDAIIRMAERVRRAPV